MTFDKWWATLETREQQRADKEFTREAFEAGAASRDAEIAELVEALEAVIPEVAGGNAGLIAYNKCKAALAKVRKP